ncbi:MAG TPA: aspartate-semialdehyde dehydrogenase [Candidatus Limnocylindria bacterium]|nr:aspartate-semialdehyde dehydrogenase [Candidatus Limnocylindria bacterium]
MGSVNGCVAILGATGLVGRMALRILEERRFPVRELRLLASRGGDERRLAFQGRELPVAPVSAEAFAGVDLALFMCDNAISRQWAPVALAAGVRVVDNSSAFRYDDHVPLVVPEINAAALECSPELVANPNCSTIAIVLALAPLQRAVGLERVVAATYQSVSGAGREALAELERGIRAGLDADPPPRQDGGAPFAFNVVPHIDRFEANGYSREEMKIVWETRKILGLPELAVTATAVRVPVRVGHAAAVNVTLAQPLEPDAARALWRAMPGLEVVDDPAQGRYPTPLAAAGRDTVLVGRARRDPSQPRGLEFFVCSDNLRKGAATNAVQIAEALPRRAAGTPSGTP